MNFWALESVDDISEKCGLAQSKPLRRNITSASYAFGFSDLDVKLAIASIDKNAFPPASCPHGFRGVKNLNPTASMRPDLTEQARIVLLPPTEVAIFGLPQRRPTASRIGKDIIMSIGNAVQRGSVVYVYDEKGRQIATISAGSGPKDGLTGYTSSTVNVRRGSLVYTYDAHGRQTASTTAR